VERARTAFQWPPRAVDVDEASAISPARPACDEPAASGRIAGWVEAVERFWAPVATPPLERRLAEAGWRPDDPEVYCDLCGGAIGPYEQNEFGCAACHGQRLRWTRFVRLGAYEGALASCVQEVKFGGWAALGERLGHMLGRKALEMGAPTGPVAVVPVPMTRWRRAARGVDHTGALARGVARAMRGRVVRALSRRPGPSQRDVPPSARAANISGVFRATRLASRRLGERPVILVDDVCTSGATLRAAARALPDGCRGERLWVAVAAVTPAPERRADGGVRPDEEKASDPLSVGTG